MIFDFLYCNYYDFFVFCQIVTLFYSNKEVHFYFRIDNNFIYYIVYNGQNIILVDFWLFNREDRRNNVFLNYHLNNIRILQVYYNTVDRKLNFYYN